MSILNLKVGCGIKNKKLMWKPNSTIRSLCLKKLLNLKMAQLFVMANKNEWIYNKLPKAWMWAMLR
jgi:hypothetical protein